MTCMYVCMYECTAVLWYTCTCMYGRVPHTPLQFTVQRVVLHLLPVTCHVIPGTVGEVIVNCLVIVIGWCTYLVILPHVKRILEY